MKTMIGITLVALGLTLAPTVATAWTITIVGTINRMTISMPVKNAVFSTQTECEANIPRAIALGLRHGDFQGARVTELPGHRLRLTYPDGGSGDIRYTCVP